jgi:predicted RNase H-like HicB family nuclease
MSKKTADMKTKRPEDYLKQPYARILIPEAEGGFSAELLEFPGCYSYGDTAEEALRNLEDAAANWVEASLAQGQHVPEPSDAGELSGRFALRLPRNLHRKATQIAERDRVSLNTFLVEAIASRVGAEDVYGRLVSELDKRLSKLETQTVAAVTIDVWDKLLDHLFSSTQSQSTPSTPTARPIYNITFKTMEVAANA